MTCDRYWREGVVLVEQGVTDLHRESCEVCEEAHASRVALVGALPLVGGENVGRADWKQRVWAEIDRGEGWRVTRVGGLAVVAAAAVLLIVLLSTRGEAPSPERHATAITIEKGAIKKRGGAQVGDRVHAQLDGVDEVRIYRVHELVFQCGAATASSVACTRHARGGTAVYELPSAGEYTILIVTGTAKSVGKLDDDLAALVDANVKYRIEQELSVR